MAAISIQLYSVLEQLHRDPVKTLGRIQEICRFCELAGTAQYSPETFARFLAETGLQAKSCHYFSLGTPFIDEQLVEFDIFMGVFSSVTRVVATPSQFRVRAAERDPRKLIDAYQQYSKDIVAIYDCIFPNYEKLSLEFHLYGVDLDVNLVEGLRCRGEIEEFNRVVFPIEILIAMLRKQREELRLFLQYDIYFAATRDVNLQQFLERCPNMVRSCHVNGCTSERTQSSLAGLNHWRNDVRMLARNGVEDFVIEHELSRRGDSAFEELQRSFVELKEVLAAVGGKGFSNGGGQ
jgi:hypothetical protein